MVTGLQKMKRSRLYIQDVNNSVSPDSSVMVAPDAELPGSSDAPPNWQLDPAVIAWANLIIDSCDWSPEDRKALQVQFNPVPDLAHLFDAVHMPPELITCFKHKSTVSSDYIFNRFSAETFLYNANLYMVTAYLPLLEVISRLSWPREQSFSSRQSIPGDGLLNCEGF